MAYTDAQPSMKSTPSLYFEQNGGGGREGDWNEWLK